MDRQHRHDLKHDKFVDEIGVLSGKARDNQRILLFLAGGLIALAAIVYGVFFYLGNKEDNAQEALAVAIETFDALVGDPPAGQPAPPQTGPRFKTEAEKTAAAEKQFKDLQSKYSGTDASDVAGLYLARIAVSRGDNKSARTLLEEFIDGHEDHILVSTARFSLYQLRIDSGEAAQVATELTAELAKTEPVLPGDALLILLAQAHEVQGEPAKARDAYRRLTTEFPESPYVVEAQRRIGGAV